MTKRAKLHQRIDEFLHTIEPKIEAENSIPGEWVFFLELDDILLNPEKLRIQVKQLLVESFGSAQGRQIWSTYGEFKRSSMLLKLPRILFDIYKRQPHGQPRSSVQEFLEQIDYKQAVYPEAEDIIKHLRNSGPVCLFTEGDWSYQELKISHSMLNTLSDQVYHFPRKLEHLPQLISAYDNHQPVFIDYRPEFLEKVKQRLDQSVTIWVDKEKISQKASSIDVHIQYLRELLDWVFE